MRSYSCLDLKGFLNGVGATYDDNREDGRFNAWGNSFPAEEIPFGCRLTLASIPFLLPEKTGNSPDHLEALGQTIKIHKPETADGMGLLCCGEMGTQELQIRVIAADRAEVSLLIQADAWLLSAETKIETDCLRFSHLHYPGNYELNLLRPALWCRVSHWRSPIIVASLILGINPLFHIFAVTLLYGDHGDQ